MNILITTTVNELEIYALLGYQTASTDNFLMTFRDNLLVPLQGPRIQKESRLYKDGVYAVKSMGGE